MKKPTFAKILKTIKKRDKKYYKMTQINKNNFEELVQNISCVHEVLQVYASKSVNQFLSLRNWIFGYYIVEYEQNGEDRAKYGENLMQEIANNLSSIKGLRFRQLYLCKDFYLTYPHFLRTVSAKLQFLDFGQNEILRTLSAKLQNDDNKENTILRSVTAKSSEIEKDITLSIEILESDKLPEKKLLENFIKRELGK